MLTKMYVKTKVEAEDFMTNLLRKDSGEQTMTTVVVMIIFVLAIAAFGIRPIREFLIGAPGQAGGGLFGDILDFFRGQATGI